MRTFCKIPSLGTAGTRPTSSLYRISNRFSRTRVTPGRTLGYRITLDPCAFASRSTPAPILSVFCSRGWAPWYLLQMASGRAELLAFGIYGATLLLLYGASTLLSRPAPAGAPAATAPDPGPHRDLLPDRGDLHSRRRCITLQRTSGGPALLAAIWTIAAAGIPFKIRYLDAPVWLSTGDLSRAWVTSRWWRWCRCRGTVGTGAGAGWSRVASRTRSGPSSMPRNGRIRCPVASDTTGSGISWCSPAAPATSSSSLCHVASI